MIKFEYGMLVLDKNTTKEDVKEIDAFAETTDENLKKAIQIAFDNIFGSLTDFLNN
jgi:hypothetical protein